MLKVLSTFSGVGGLDKPFHDDKNFEIIGFFEIENNACEVLAYKYGDIKNYGDITEIDTATLPDFDVLVGGSPCQSFSTSGSREGLKGKSGLLLSYLKLLRDKRPKYFVWENVTGTLSSTKGWDLARLHLEVASIGYQVRQQVLSPLDYGLGQARSRIFIVGYLGKDRDTCKVLFKGLPKG